MPEVDGDQLASFRLVWTCHYCGHIVTSLRMQEDGAKTPSPHYCRQKQTDGYFYEWMNEHGPYFATSRCLRDGIVWIQL
jgi:hypothetical protein